MAPARDSAPPTPRASSSSSVTASHSHSTLESDYCGLTVEELERTIECMRKCCPVKDRRYRLTMYRRCFVGREMVDVMIDKGLVKTRAEAVHLGCTIQKLGYFWHVLRENGFRDGYYFYRWREDLGHGKQRTKTDGQFVSWADLLPMNRLVPQCRRDTTCSLQPDIGDSKDGQVTDSESVASTYSFSSISGKPMIESPDLAVEEDIATKLGPLDRYNLRTLDLLHPPGWVDPSSTSKYNMVIVGGGMAGLSTAASAARMGAKVALIEEGFLGGQCTVTGCVPSKALIAAARTVASLKRSNLEEMGIRLVGGYDVKVNFERVMERVRRLRAELAPMDSAQRFSSTLGVDVYIGRGKLSGKNTVLVNGQTLKFSKAVIATGAAPAIPADLSDLYKQYEADPENAAVILTYENLFNLTKLPPRLSIIGHGSFAVEMAQAFARLGSKVTIIDPAPRILANEDEDLATRIKEILATEGVDFCLSVTSCESIKSSVPDRKCDADANASQESSSAFPREIAFTLGTAHGGKKIVVCDAVLIAVGRKPRIRGLGLRRAGIKYRRSGIVVDDFLRTSNPNVYAAGDVCDTPFRYAAAGDFMARLASRNALFLPKMSKFSDLLIPWVTHTEPELAHVGLYEADMRARGIAYETVEQEFADNDRSLLDSSSEGLVRMHIEHGSGKILGASILGAQASDLISEITTAMEADMTVAQLASVIHPYPSRAEAIRACGEDYNREKLSKKKKAVMRSVMRITR